MAQTRESPPHWQALELHAPQLPHPVAVIAAKDIAYVTPGNRLQNLSVYLPRTSHTESLLSQESTATPVLADSASTPRTLVHIHGGAWRDPMLGSASIEAAVAHAFDRFNSGSPITAVVSINYTLTQFPTHPGNPYDATRDQPRDPAREALHPEHVSDLFRGFQLLRTLGLRDQSYLLSGHSCGACLAFQVSLQGPAYYGLTDIPDIPCPAAMLGLNGLYDLPALVYGLGPSHEQCSSDYRSMLSYAFGPEESKWWRASPAHFDPTRLSARVQEGKSPRIVLLDQSIDDQLVPLNQRDRCAANLSKVSGIKVILGKRCAGKHAIPWQQGLMIWDAVRDALEAVKATI